MPNVELEKCPKCGFKSMYTRKDGSKRCKRCRYDTRTAKAPEQKPEEKKPEGT
jgi:uncharacterized Zn finger protein (UPF0148 family)